MQREAHFLRYRPSQIAAAALLFSINISQSIVAPKILEIKQIQPGQMEVLLNETFGLLTEAQDEENKAALTVDDE